MAAAKAKAEEEAAVGVGLVGEAAVGVGLVGRKQMR